MLRPVKYVAMVCGLVWLFAVPAAAARYRVKTIDEAPPTDELSEEIAAQLQPKAVRIERGKKVLCDIWLRKQWPVRHGFEPTGEILYPFEPGELIGVIRYHRQGEDFRGQQLEPGVYTMRYALQPVDGNHVGTSDTRDFVLLLPAAEDQEVAPLDEQSLVDLSTEASGTTHPALLAMRAVGEGAADEVVPTMRHDEDRDLWSVRVRGKTNDADKPTLPVEIVVVGQAEL